MASGVPVVAARAGGIPDIITDDDAQSEHVNGLMFAPGDADDFCDKVVSLFLATPSPSDAPHALRARIAANARAEVEAWSWRAATRTLANVQYTAAEENKRREVDAPTAAGRLVRSACEALRRAMVTIVFAPILVVLFVVRGAAWTLARIVSMQSSLVRKSASYNSIRS